MAQGNGASGQLDGGSSGVIPLAGISVKSVKVGYPIALATEFSLKENVLSIDFSLEEQARLFEIDIEGEYRQSRVSRRNSGAATLSQHFFCQPAFRII